MGPRCARASFLDRPQRWRDFPAWSARSSALSRAGETAIASSSPASRSSPSRTLLVDAIGTVLIYYAERGAPDSEITSLGDALFFTTTQLLTVSSQIRNPFTTWGRVVDVGLEIWGALVVAGSTGAAAAFFLQADD